MTWLKVDDNSPSHPKWIALMDRDPTLWMLCKAVWTDAGCYASQHLTDGVVTRGALRRLVPLDRAEIERAADGLVSVGLWDEHPDGWAFHDWHEYNPSRADVMAKRKRDADRKRRARQDEHRACPSGQTADVHADAPPIHNDVRADKPRTSARTDRGRPHGKIAESAPPGPARPDPTHPAGDARARVMGEPPELESGVAAPFPLALLEPEPSLEPNSEPDMNSEPDANSAPDPERKPARRASRLKSQPRPDAELLAESRVVTGADREAAVHALWRYQGQHRARIQPNAPPLPGLTLGGAGDALRRLLADTPPTRLRHALDVLAAEAEAKRDAGESEPLRFLSASLWTSPNLAALADAMATTPDARRRRVAQRHRPAHAEPRRHIRDL